jgi:protein-tyrosine phosphatase
MESYWVKPAQLLAGEYPGRATEDATRQIMDAFLGQGFDTFIDLTSAGELPAYQPILLEQARLHNIGASHQRFPIGDFGLPTRSQMADILNAIDSALGSGRKVYVHCWGGIGRTGTTVGCYLVRQGLSGEQALRQLADWWRHVPKSIFHRRSPETDEQMQFILNWKE